MNKVISGEGWFVHTLSALVVGSMDVIKERNPMSAIEIFSSLDLLVEMGLTHVVDVEWVAIDHPILGLLQWRRDAYNESSITLQRDILLNGRNVITVLTSGDICEVEWTAEEAKSKISEEEKVIVEGYLAKSYRPDGSREDLAFNQLTIIS